MSCEHAWLRRADFEGTTHFKDEPNSRRRHKAIRPLICAACGQRGFQYPPSRVVYTWTRNEEEWEQ